MNLLELFTVLFTMTQPQIVEVPTVIIQQPTIVCTSTQPQVKGCKDGDVDPFGIVTVPEY